MHRYAAGVDDRQFDSVAELFTDDSRIDAARAARRRWSRSIGTAVRLPSAPRSPPSPPIDPHRARDRRRGLRRRPAARHRPRAHRVRRASLESNTAIELIDVVWHLRYDDEYQLTDADWRICRRALTINAIETRPVRQVRRGGASA